MIDNAPNTLDNLNDPETSAFDLKWVRGFTPPALLTAGDQTAPIFPPAINRLAEALPSLEVQKFAGARHIIQTVQPEDFAEAIN